jgi:hypothetical protein
MTFNSPPGKNRATLAPATRFVGFPRLQENARAANIALAQNPEFYNPNLES